MSKPSASKMPHKKPASEKNKFRDFLKNNRYLLICAINFFCMDRIFLWMVDTEKTTGFPEITSVLFSLAWVLIFLAIVILLPGKLKKAAIICLPLFYNILILVHCGMFSFNDSLFSFSDMMFADDGAAFFHLDYISISPWLIAAMIVSFALSILSAIWAPKKQCKKQIVTVLMAAVFLAGGIGLVKLVEKNWLNDYVTVSWDSYKQYSDLYQSFNDSVSSMALCGIYQYTFRDAWMTSGVDRIIRGEGKIVDSITEYYNTKESTPDNEMTGALEGKNLILIQLEAIDTWMLTPEAMPHLYELQQQSIQFTNHYAPLYLSGGTFNTEIMVNTGHFPPFYGGKTGVYSENAYPLSMVNLFNAKGYTSRSFHNSNGDVYARGQVHTNWGYEKYYSGEEIGMPDIDFDSGLIEGFEQMTEGTPFFSFIITYSAHGPYLDSRVSEAYYNTFAAKYPDADETYIHAMAHAYETDLFIGSLVEELKAAGLWENTALVFYSDHYNYYTLDDQLVMGYKNIYDENLIKNVLFFICSSDLNAKKVEKVTSSIDILPTVINLFDLDADDRFLAGYDGFSEDGGYVIFEDYSWYDGETYHIYGTETNDPAIAERNEEINQRMYYSNNVLLTDYFAHNK